MISSILDMDCEMQINISLTAAVRRLKKTREERDKFDEANNKILLHLKAKVSFKLFSCINSLRNLLICS